MPNVQAGANIWAIDSNGQGPVKLYDANGNPLSRVNRAAVDPTLLAGVPLMGADYKLSRLVRVSSTGDLLGENPQPLFYDQCEGAAVDTNKWIQTTTTMTIAQASGSITFNSGSSVAANVGAMHTTHRTFPYVSRNSMLFRARIKPDAHFTNNLIELGFGAPSTAIAAGIGIGAAWRKDGTGQWLPVLSIVNNTETLGNPISNATFIAAVPTTDFAVFEVFMETTRATFRILTITGILVSEQVIELPAAAADLQATHLQAFFRTYQLTAPATATRPVLASAAVYNVDNTLGLDVNTMQAMLGYGSLVSPTAYTQLANYANSAAPTLGTPSNVAAGYTTLGGQFSIAAPVGAETDLALFAFTNPSPYNLIIKRVSIATYNMGAVVATTPTTLQWGLGFNSSAVSLATAAPYPPMRKAIGAQWANVGAVIGQPYVDPVVTWEGNEIVFPGRFFHVILKVPVGTATASQLIRGTCSVEGFFV